MRENDPSCASWLPESSCFLCTTACMFVVVQSHLHRMVSRGFMLSPQRHQHPVLHLKVMAAQHRLLAPWCCWQGSPAQGPPKPEPCRQHTQQNCVAATPCACLCPHPHPPPLFRCVLPRQPRRLSVQLPGRPGVAGPPGGHGGKQGSSGEAEGQRSSCPVGQALEPASVLQPGLPGRGRCGSAQDTGMQR